MRELKDSSKSLKSFFVENSDGTRLFQYFDDEKAGIAIKVVQKDGHGSSDYALSHRNDILYILIHRSNKPVLLENGETKTNRTHLGY